MNNPYEVLHLEEDASYEDIKERYRHLTRYLHPDKQPLENYTATKKLFQQIDEAYKSISSPLRRYIYRQYGLSALRILQQFPSEFKQFQVEHLTHQQEQHLKQLMIYLLYEREAAVELDRSKFNTKSLINASKILSKKQTNKLPSKRNLNLPELQNTSFEYELALPEMFGFSHSVSVAHSSNNLRSDPKYMMGTTFSSVKRFATNYMLVVQPSVTSEDHGLEVSIDRICEHNLHLKFTPISISNWNIARPKFAIEKSFGQSQFSAITDLASTSFQFSDYTPSRVNRSIRVYIDGGNLNVVPKIEWPLSKDIRFFVQLTNGFVFQGNENNISIQGSIAYGYKLIIADDFKLEFTSSIGYPNYFQLSVITSKFRAAMPIVTAEGTQTQFQAYKISIMLLSYFLYRFYHWRQKHNKILRQKLLQQQQTRFNEQRRQLQRQNSYLEMASAFKIERQVKYNGLIVIKAILGEKGQAKTAEKRINKIKVEHKDTIAETKSFIEEKINELGLMTDDFTDQLCDVTLIIQNEVNGGQIMGFNMDKLQPFNPILSDTIRPYLVLCYLERGQFKTKIVECNGKLWLGGPRSDDKKGDHFLNRMFRKISKFFL